MKKFSLYVYFLGAFLLMTPSSFGQGGKKKEQKQPKAGKAEKSQTEKALAKRVKDTALIIEAKDKEKNMLSDSAKGNAYGKNKGTLPGKEFGQLRSEKARQQVAAQKGELKSEIEKSENTIKDTAEKIAQATLRLEKIKSKGELTEEEIQKKEMALDQAINKLEALKEKVQNQKAAINQE